VDWRRGLDQQPTADLPRSLCVKGDDSLGPQKHPPVCLGVWMEECCHTVWSVTAFLSKHRGSPSLSLVLVEASQASAAKWQIPMP